MTLLTVRNIIQTYKQQGTGKQPFLTRKAQHNETLKAVNRVSMDINENEAIGLVGESGSGKSTLARMICRMEAPASGHVFWKGRDIHQLPRQQIKPFRREVQMIYQDTLSSLSPQQNVRQIIEEPIRNFKLAAKSQRTIIIEQLLSDVGLDPALIDRYPGTLSGGQVQRVNIARALAAQPALIVCDESVSSLDAVLRLQMIDLLKDMKIKHRLSYLFISHDIGAVARLCDRIAVIYQGEIVECFDTEQLWSAEHHPYTQTLLASILVPNPRKR